MSKLLETIIPRSHDSHHQIKGKRSLFDHKVNHYLCHHKKKKKKLA